MRHSRRRGICYGRLMNDVPDKFFPRSPEYWLKRAVDARMVAAQIKDPDGKSLMLQVAEMYEALARRRPAPGGVE